MSGSRAGCVAATLVVLLGGCVTETKTDRPADRKISVRQTPAARQTAAPTGPAVLPNEATDPCANRLHELSGALLTYYAINKKLPETLAEAETLADATAEFNTECPVSRQPYVYAPRGLQAQGQDRLLILYDPTPAHAGLRWGVFIAPPRDGQLPSTYVLIMSPEVFRSYVK